VSSDAVAAYLRSQHRDGKAEADSRAGHEANDDQDQNRMPSGRMDRHEHMVVANETNMATPTQSMVKTIAASSSAAVGKGGELAALG